MGHPCRVPDAHGGKRLVSPLKMSGDRRARTHIMAGTDGWIDFLCANSQIRNGQEARRARKKGSDGQDPGAEIITQFSLRLVIVKFELEV
jgi:hypothetical protein